MQLLVIAQDTPQIQAVSFDNVSVKTALRNLVDSATRFSATRFDAVFDDSVTDSRLTIEMKNVTIRQAIEAILEKKGLQVKMKDDKTLLFFADTPENREKYAEMLPWAEKSANPGIK